ncbi:cyclic nucleotide-binding domain-containing protein [bacterium]|nr:cyclic nucleotide-binding domain-containing protein [bacterium]
MNDLQHTLTHTHTYIHRYFHHYYDHTTSFDEAQILRELSEQLRIEVSSFMAYQTFHEVRLFRRYNVKYLTVILLSAKPVRIQQGEVIFRAGKIGTEMYIITTGRVRSYFKTETERAELQDKTSGRVLTTNDTFGELVCSHSLFLSLSHSHTHTHIPSRIQKPKRSAPSVYRTKDKRQLFRRQ